MAVVYLIPTVLHEGAVDCLSPYILDAVKKCTILFVENERTARRYLKTLSKQIVIDDFEWYTIKEISSELTASFRQKIKDGATIGIISEAGCPGIADPGQQLVDIAQQMNVEIKPLAGPSSILLALMASGMNGQHFRFNGYLPIDAAERVISIQQMESESKQKACTQIFIETPYRNNQLLEALIKTCQPHTKICVAVDLTAPTEKIQTKTVQQWKGALPQLHKRPAIFLMYAANA
jgi:16S rRNA (cytidine1402-2'-O)-methyltransferase